MSSENRFPLFGIMLQGQMALIILDEPLTIPGVLRMP